MFSEDYNSLISINYFDSMIDAETRGIFFRKETAEYAVLAVLVNWSHYKWQESIYLYVQFLKWISMFYKICT